MRIPSIDPSCEAAFCCAMVWPELLSACEEALAAFCTCAPISTSDCSAVLVTLIVVLILVMVSVKAEMFDSCARAAIAKPSLTPMPA